MTYNERIYEGFTLVQGDDVERSNTQDSYSEYYNDGCIGCEMYSICHDSDMNLDSIQVCVNESLPF